MTWLVELRWLSSANISTPTCGIVSVDRSIRSLVESPPSQPAGTISLATWASKLLSQIENRYWHRNKHLAFLGSSSHLMRSALAPSQATVRSSNGSTNCASTLESKAKLVSFISRRALRISQVNIRQRQHGRRSKLVFKILTRPTSITVIIITCAP